MWRIYLLVLIISTAESINRPAYKIVLTQKGFTQFLQYDVDTPPIREFTLCVWIRTFELSGDQTIFTYMVNRSNRVIKLWLDEEGFIKILINGKASSSTAIDMTPDTWRHICLSYQSDFGAWALYIDGRLASCEAAQSLYGYVLPGGGSFMFGYGMTENGNPSGLEGEVFGVNILLSSTIERNYTIKKNLQYQQKDFRKNKFIDSSNDNFKYVVLGQPTLKTAESFETLKHSTKPPRNFIKFKTPYSQFEHDIGVDLNPRHVKIELANEKEISDISILNKNYDSNNIINFWDLVNKAGNIGKFKDRENKQFEQFVSSTKELSTVSEFETPPPPEAAHDYSLPKFKVINRPVKISFQTNGIDMISSVQNTKRTLKQEIPDKVVPPPVEKKEKVYGQWTTSSFANDVLNYLKSVNVNNKEQKKVPSTIPLLKVSDSFPYSSDLKITRVFAPYNIQRRSYQNEHQIHKRESRHPQINVKILENDIRTLILEEHAKTHPQNVEIKSRGTHEMDKDHRFYRNVESQNFEELPNNNENHKFQQLIPKPKNQIKPKPKPKKRYFDHLTNIPSFLKFDEYFTSDNESNHENIDSNKMYTKSLSNANKWHNVKSYSNDFVAREINIESDEIHRINHEIAEENKEQTSILKYTPKSNKVVESYEDAAMVEGRTIATEISNLSRPYPNMVSILKYNHGFFPNQKTSTMKSQNLINKTGKTKNNFDQHIKIGNALNEREIIGESGEENKRSFVGGNENVPDINRYRSDIDKTKAQVPPSLGPKICKNVELLDRLFYVQPDGSVDVSQILSPVKNKNIGIEFVIQNYRKCLLQESDFEKNSLLLIDWSKTPVRLFGGAYPKKTIDLCGFF